MASAAEDLEGAGAGKSDKQKQGRDRLIVIGVALVGLVLAYLTYKHSKSTTTTAATTYAATPGYPPASSGQSSATASYFQQGIQQLGTAISALGAQQKAAVTQIAQMQQAQATATAQSQAGLVAAISALGTQLKADLASSPQQAQSVGGTGTVSVPTTTAPNTPQVAGAFQVAPTYNPFSYGGATYTPTANLPTTAGSYYLKTTSTGMAVPETLAQVTAIEHGGTRKFPQYTTYTKA